MKNSILLLLIVMAVMLTTFTGCGTLLGALTKGKRPVYLIDRPNNLTAAANGDELDITSEAFAATSSTYSTTTYFTSAVKLPYKEAMTLNIKSGSQSAEIALKPKGWSVVWWGNFVFAIGVGHVIDAITDNNKTLFPRFIDVPAALAGKPQSEWRSKGQLKRQTKRKIKRAN